MYVALGTNVFEIPEDNLFLSHFLVIEASENLGLHVWSCPVLWDLLPFPLK